MWLRSSSNYDYAAQGQKQWGNASLGDVPLLGDVDGDAKADLIVWRASTGTWYWLTSSSGYSYASFGSRQWGNGAFGDVPLVGDFDVDGRADLVVWRPANGIWYWLTSSSGYNYASAGLRQWGNASFGDQPFVGDFDGDHRSDVAIWRASTGTWFWLTSSTGYAYANAGVKQWGNQSLGDIPMLADFDGDGRADLTVWRQPSGMWFWLPSSTNYHYATAGAQQFGAAGDIPPVR
jgi:hypothetical protein